jgi:hypothetical protein
MPTKYECNDCLFTTYDKKAAQAHTAADYPPPKHDTPGYYERPNKDPNRGPKALENLFKGRN